MNNFALNLGKADAACPSIKFWQRGVDCWHTGMISNNYLAIIIIDKNKNKLMTKGYVPI